MTNKLYNGKIIFHTNQKDLMLKYDSVRKAIYHRGLKKNSVKNGNGQFINFDAYKKLYKIIGVGNKDNIFKKDDKLNSFTSISKNNNSTNNIKDKNLSYSIENIKYKTLFSKNIEFNPMMKTYSLLKKGGNKFKLFNDKIKEKYTNQNSYEYSSNDEKFKKTITTEFDKINDESLNNSFYINNKKKNNFKNLNIYSPQYFIINNHMNNNLTIEKYNKTVNTFYKNRKKNLSKKENKLNNMEKDNYSNISEEKKNDNNYLKKFKTGCNFRSIKDIKIKTSRENFLLKGFISPESKNQMKFKNYKNRKKDSTLKNYMNELELIKKVNKIAVEKEKRINLFRDNLLKKKLEGKKIFEQNYKNS